MLNDFIIKSKMAFSPNGILMDEQVELEQQMKEKEKAFASFNTKSFVLVVVLLSVLLAVSGALSYFIPQGFYQEVNGVIVDGTYVKGAVDGVAIWRVLTAPVRVFFSKNAVTIVFICVFLLIMSGVFNLLDKTDGIRIFIGKTVRKFSKKRKVVVCATVLVFMLFGSFFGMFEELITLLPLVIICMLSLGMDTLTGLGVCMLGACFGFAAAITNPFSVGLVASEFTGTNVLQGAWLRIVFFVLIYTLLCAFLLNHVRRIGKNPEKSLTYKIDLERKNGTDFCSLEDSPCERRIFKVYATFFAVQMVMLVLIASIRAIANFAIPLLAFSFLFGGIVAGLCVCGNKRDVARYMWQGAKAMLPAILLIALASSVNLILEESGILHTIMHEVIEFLRDKDKFVCVILIYLLILFLQIFIGSASAKIFLIMPLLLPISTALGLSPTLVIFTYCIADGFTDMILPTNPILLIGLSVANVSYGKWVRWTWKLQVVVFTLTLLMLLFAVYIGY